MAFIFTSDGDPRGDSMADTYTTGESVTFAGHVMPATILSGPHKTHGTGQRRWLIRKADDMVSLVRESELRKRLTRQEVVARALFKSLSVRAVDWALVPAPSQRTYLNTADAVLRVLDALPAEVVAKPEPLRVGDRIRILENQHAAATVDRGDVLRVTRAVVAGRFHTDAPKSRYQSRWVFHVDAEGTGWERA